MRKIIPLTWEQREWVMACVDFYRDILGQLVKKATEAKKYETASAHEKELMNLANIQSRLMNATFQRAQGVDLCQVEFEEFEAKAVYYGIERVIKKLERMVKDARLIRKDHIGEEYGAMAEGLTTVLRPLFGAQLDMLSPIDKETRELARSLTKDGTTLTLEE